MAFMDSIKGFGHKVSEKTKDTTEVYKLNSQKQALKKELESLYMQIGEIVVNKGVDGVEECSALVQQAKQNKAQMDEIQKQVDILQGMVSCPQCNNSVKQGTIFCNMCGYKFPIPEVNRCTKCGSPLLENAAFCTACGTPIQQVAPIPTPMPTPEPTPMPTPMPTPEPTPMPTPMPTPEPTPMPTPMPTPEPIPTPIPTPTPTPMPTPTPTPTPMPTPTAGVICVNCGKQLAFGAKFCTKCGARVEAAPIPTAMPTNPGDMNMPPMQ